MAGGKQSPRQKMINMMYLVLTALLALNVTKEILLAFTVIDNSLKKSTANIDLKTVKMVESLQKLSGDNVAAASALKLSNSANTITKGFVESIHSIKTDLLRYSLGATDPKQTEVDPLEAFNIRREEK